MGIPWSPCDSRADIRELTRVGGHSDRHRSSHPRPFIERRSAMIGAIWGMARHDLAVWLRSPAAIAAALLPALGMGVLVAVLTSSVGQQPVALVVQGQGRLATRMARIIKADADAYLIDEMAPADAERA